MNPTPAIETAIRQRAAELERFSERVTGMQVIVDMPQRNRHSGNQYAVRINITTRSGDLSLTHAPASDETRGEFLAVLRNAFDSAARQLENQPNGAPSSQPAPQGRVTRLFSNVGYGFLATPEGEEVYFHENIVSEAAFARLVVGSLVSFTLLSEDSEHGARAAHVQLLPAEISPSEAAPSQAAPSEAASEASPDPLRPAAV